MVIGAMVDLVKEVDPMFFDKIGLATLRSRDAARMAFPRPRPSGDAFAANSIAGWAAACRGCATGRPAPSASSPTRCAPRSA